MGAYLIDATYWLAGFDDAKAIGAQMQRFLCGECSFKRTDLSEDDLSNSVLTINSGGDQRNIEKPSEATMVESTTVLGGISQQSKFIVSTLYEVSFTKINGYSMSFRDCAFSSFHCLKCRLDLEKIDNSELSQSQLQQNRV